MSALILRCWRIVGASVAVALGLMAHAAQFDLEWGRISSGTILSAQGGDYEISGTVGQPETGEVSGCCLGVQSGFWVITLTNAAPPVSSEGAADLFVNVLESADPVRLGDLVTYTLVISNQGPATARNVLLTNHFPAGMELVSASSLRPITIAGTELVASLEGVQVNTCVEVQIVARAVSPGLHTNSASITSGSSDLYPQSNIAAETTTVLSREPRTFHWSGTVSQAWENPNNWTPTDGPPGLGDTAIVDLNRWVTITTNAMVSRLITAGNFDGAGNLLIATEMLWTGGFLLGTGTIDIIPGARLRLEGDLIKPLQRPLNNSGTIEWAGTGALHGHSGPILKNFAGAEFIISSDTALTRFNSPLVVENAGTIRKIGTGAQAIEADFHNRGMISIESGSVTINGRFGNDQAVIVSSGASLAISGSGTNQGTFHLETGAGLHFRGSTHFLEDGATITGSGVALVESGVLHTLGNVRIENLAVSAGELRADGILDLLGNVEWTGGRISGAGTHRIGANAVMELTGGGQKTLFATTLENSGTIHWNDSGPLNGHDRPVLNNLAGGTFEWSSAAPVTRFNAGMVLNNSGSVHAAFSGTKTAEIEINNQGQFLVEQGQISVTSPFGNHDLVVLENGAVLDLTISSTNSGRFNLQEQTTLRFGGDTHYLENGAEISGPGVVSIVSGMLYALGDARMENVALGSGELRADGVVDIPGHMAWTGGRISGAGRSRLAAAAVLDITGPNQKTLSATTLENHGTINWLDAGALNGHDQPIIRNMAGGTINTLTDAPFTRFNAGAIIQNAGVFRRAATAGTKPMDVAFHNSGKLELEGGILQLARSFTNAASGEVSFAIRGATAVSDFGQLQVNAAVTLDGTLSARIASTFSPLVPASFLLMTSSAMSGTFSETAGLQLPNIRFVPVYTATSLSLATTNAPPDLPLVLQIARQPEGVRLNWPPEYASVAVEFAPGISNSEWKVAPILRNELFSVGPTNQTMFFRLRTP